MLTEELIGQPNYGTYFSITWDTSAVDFYGLESSRVASRQAIGKRLSDSRGSHTRRFVRWDGCAVAKLFRGRRWIIHISGCDLLLLARFAPSSSLMISIHVVFWKILPEEVLKTKKCQVTLERGCVVELQQSVLWGQRTLWPTDVGVTDDEKSKRKPCKQRPATYDLDAIFGWVLQTLYDAVEKTCWACAYIVHEDALDWHCQFLSMKKS